MITRWVRLPRHSVYTNSAYLLLSSVALSGLGFAFWSISTRLYSTSDVGTAAALLGALNLITSLSLVGFEISIIRFLPGHPDKSALLNVGLTLSSLLGAAVAVTFLLLQPLVSPSLASVRANVAIEVMFTCFVVVSVSSYILESTFIAYRGSRYVLRKNVVFSVAKLALIFATVALGAFGIYSAWMLGLTIAVIYSLFIVAKKFGHSLKPQLGLRHLRGMWAFSGGNYVAAFAEGLPIMVLPLLIINLYGPDQAAYYYMAMVIANFLFTISIAASQSLFAEVSYVGTDVPRETKKALAFIFVLLVPSTAIVFVFGPDVLAWFGRGYSENGTVLLYLLSASAVLVAVNSLLRTILKVRLKTAALTLISFVGAGVLLLLAGLLTDLGLAGVGVAWLAGQAVSCLALCYVVMRGRLLTGDASDE